MSHSSPQSFDREHELISGFIDDELTQQEAQKVLLKIETDPEYQRIYHELTAMRQEVQGLSLQAKELEHLDKLFQEPVVKTTRIFGLALIAITGVALIGLTFYFIFTHPSIGLLEKILVGALGGGTFLLLISVLRQRLLSLKNDKYNGVKI